MNPVKFLRNFKKFNETNFIFLFFKLLIHIYLFKFYKEKLKCIRYFIKQFDYSTKQDFQVKQFFTISKNMNKIYNV